MPRNNWPYVTVCWRDLRELKLAEMPFCESCGSSRSLEVHHQNPLTDKQRENRDEMAAYPPLEHLQVYCKPCHAKVTRGKQSQLDTSDAEWASFIQTRGKEHASKSEIET